MESRGVETEVELRLSGDLSLRGSYGYNPTEVLRAASAPALVGKESRANARHNYTVIAAYERATVANVAVTVRSAGRRFEDDLNQLDLESFVVTDLQGSRRITSQTQLFLGVENLFDVEYPVSRANTGLVRIGGPRLLEGGIRYRW
jgi:outer membrane receptor protein involved in Fe transport